MCVLKRSISFSIVCLFMLTMSVSAFAKTPDSQIPNNPRTQVSKANRLKEEAKQQKANAYMKSKLKNINKIKKPSLGISTNYVPGPTDKVLGVNTIVENPDYNCGPAATLQDANWKDPHNPYYQSDNDNPYNETETYNLSKLEGTADSHETYMKNIPGPLNDASGTGTYYYAGNMSSESQMVSDIVYDTDHQYPTVVNVATDKLDYYGGAFYLHYISSDGYEQTSSGDVPDIHVVDDNYVSSFSGKHWTSTLGLWNAVHYFGSNPNLVW